MALQRHGCGETIAKVEGKSRDRNLIDIDKGIDIASNVTAIEQLRDMAMDQHGLIITAQASAKGVSYSETFMMVARDRLDRVANGVYPLSAV